MLMYNITYFIVLLWLNLVYFSEQGYEYVMILKVYADKIDYTSIINNIIHIYCN